MLNELLTLENSAKNAHIPYVPLHPDLKSVGKMKALVVELGEKGQIEAVRPLPNGITPWTIRDGLHNSFPVMQPKAPFLDVNLYSSLRNAAVDRKNTEQRKDLLTLIKKVKVDENAYGLWPGTRMITRLEERQRQLSEIKDESASIVPETFSRFLKAFDPKMNGSSVRTVSAIVQTLTKLLETNSNKDLVETATGLLLGEEKEKGQWACHGGLIFEASGFKTSIIDPKLQVIVSRALSLKAGGNKQVQSRGVCALTGELQELLEGNYPQPNLPVVGLTWLFAKNRDIPANDRYERFAQQSMPVGKSVVERLSGALTAFTNKERENITWRMIPGDKPKMVDLFLTFADLMPSVPMAGVFAADEYADESRDDNEKNLDSIGFIEKQAHDLLECFEGKPSRISAGSESLAHIMVIRKVDTANRKVVYSDSYTLRDLIYACDDWAEGERNVPPWMRLPARFENEKRTRLLGSVHTAPMRFSGLSKVKYIRSGEESEELIGISTQTLMRIFMSKTMKETSYGCVYSTLHLMLERRGALIISVAHGRRRHNDFFPKGTEVPKTTAALGLLLYKIGRKKEEYMNDAAFKLGQLLAAADVIHAGYCADVRKGSIPPSLLGNQCLGLAQKDPLQALVVLGRRWKPYDGWVKKMLWDKNANLRIESLKNSDIKKEKQHGWDIMVALRYAREVRPIAAELSSALHDVQVDDAFRAELLLGYIAGLPKTERSEKEADNSDVMADEEKEK